jgi:hypothetical protein
LAGTVGRGGSRYRNEQRTADLLGAVQGFEYDTDGKVTKDGMGEYFWDASGARSAEMAKPEVCTKG